jgi:hypothetical protein
MRVEDLNVEIVSVLVTCTKKGGEMLSEEGRSVELS